MRMGSRKVGDVVEIAKKESPVKFTANLLAGLTLSLFAALSSAQEKAVYHFDSGVEQATKGLRNINNHLEVDPKARLIAVTHADGVDFLMEGAKDRLGLCALLVRPDGVVAWASDTTPNPDDVTRAAAKWFAQRPGA